MSPALIAAVLALADRGIFDAELRLILSRQLELDPRRIHAPR
jgi:hypothetical protein